MAFINELDVQVINYEHKLDRAPLVAPKARSGGGVVISSCIEALLKEFVTQDSGVR